MSFHLILYDQYFRAPSNLALIWQDQEDMVWTFAWHDEPTFALVVQSLFGNIPTEFLLIVELWTAELKFESERNLPFQTKMKKTFKLWSKLIAFFYNSCKSCAFPSTAFYSRDVLISLSVTKMFWSGPFCVKISRYNKAPTSESAVAFPVV